MEQGLEELGLRTTKLEAREQLIDSLRFKVAALERKTDVLEAHEATYSLQRAVEYESFVTR